jgi:hypothetical protein
MEQELPTLPEHMSGFHPIVMELLFNNEWSEALGFRWPSYIGKSGTDYMNEKVSLFLLTRFNVCSLFSSWIQLKYCSLDVKQQPTNQSITVPFLN